MFRSQQGQKTTACTHIEHLEISGSVIFRAYLSKCLSNCITICFVPRSIIDHIKVPHVLHSGICGGGGQAQGQHWVTTSLPFLSPTQSSEAIALLLSLLFFGQGFALPRQRCVHDCDLLRASTSTSTTDPSLICPAFVVLEVELEHISTY
jgi:hypothetical protein